MAKDTSDEKANPAESGLKPAANKKGTRTIRMLTLAAGPDGILQAGAVVDVPAAQADAFIAGRYAEEVKRE